MSKPVTFGDRLREARSAKHYTQQQVADELHISRVAYGYYENNAREMRQSDITAVCKLLDVSADYLLGLSDTKKPEYARIAETTGLNQESIQRLNQFVHSESEIINHLLAEEPVCTTYIDPKYEAYLSSPEYNEAAYQEHLKSLAWEKEMKKTHILKHLENDWAHWDHEMTLTEEDYIAQAEAYCQEYAREHAGDIPEPSPDDFDFFTEEEYLKNEENMRKWKEREARKSKLLSSITDYVKYRSGCTLHTMTWFEELTETHSIRIGTGLGQTITFPSKECDELLEFMLLQKVIEALKTFKKNRFSNE